MNKLTVIGVVIILVIIGVSGYILVNNIHFDNNKNAGNTNTNESVKMLTISKGGVTVNYPSNWVLSQATSNNSIIAISKQNAVDNREIGQININVEKKEYSGDFNSFVNKSYTNIKADKSFNLASSGEVAINDEKALQYIYTSSSNNGVVKQHKALWFERGNQAYVIMYSAPVDKYEVNLPAADYIISHIKIN